MLKVRNYHKSLKVTILAGVISSCKPCITGASQHQCCFPARSHCVLLHQDVPHRIIAISGHKSPAHKSGASLRTLFPRCLASYRASCFSKVGSSVANFSACCSTGCCAGCCPDCVGEVWQRCCAGRCASSMLSRLRWRSVAKVLCRVLLSVVQGAVRVVCCLDCGGEVWQRCSAGCC